MGRACVIRKICAIGANMQMIFTVKDRDCKQAVKRGSGMAPEDSRHDDGEEKKRGGDKNKISSTFIRV